MKAPLKKVKALGYESKVRENKKDNIGIILSGGKLVTIKWKVEKEKRVEEINGVDKKHVNKRFIFVENKDLLDKYNLLEDNIIEAKIKQKAILAKLCPKFL